MCRIPGRLMGVLILVVCTILAGCAAAPRERRLAIAPGVPRPVAAHIVDYQSAVDAIVSVITDDLQMPVPRTSFTVYFYPSREAFAQGLTYKFNTDPMLAGDIAKFAQGRIYQTKESRQLLVNGEILESQRWLDRIRFLAHEITHIVHYELANKTHAGDRWLKEGFADWVAFRVLESLGLDTFSRRRNQQIARVKRAKERQPLPALAEMVITRDWETLSSRHGGAMTYGQAFLATDFLIERRGLFSVIDYFRLFTRSNDRLRNFQAAFGKDLAAFEREFTAHLERLLNERSVRSLRKAT
jgi:hypothetical protein